MEIWPEFTAGLTLAAWVFTGCFVLYLHLTEPDDDDDDDTPAAT